MLSFIGGMEGREGYALVDCVIGIGIVEYDELT